MYLQVRDRVAAPGGESHRAAGHRVGEHGDVGAAGAREVRLRKALDDDPVEREQAGRGKGLGGPRACRLSVLPWCWKEAAPVIAKSPVRLCVNGPAWKLPAVSRRSPQSARGEMARTLPAAATGARR